MGAIPKSDREIFDAALEIADAAGRTAFLDRECAGDPEQRERVQALVVAFESAGAFMETRVRDAGEAKPAPGPSTRIVERPQEGLGSVIGNYKLLQEIGEGGFGVVYMAEQARPVKRKVALKIIKPGMDTREVVARFEAERQALALMLHPNIAQVLDAGATDTGKPFFVMELVRGIPITEFCDQNKLSTTQRLGLFLDICGAIQHAHQKGVIHRDIKPSNILITLHDGQPVPKVIDFGIAKALNQELTEKTLFTAYGQMIGTPLYTSPEQAEMSGLDIDTRSDIYSLGVLLYELLTGETPISRKELKDAGYQQMLKLIREKEPTTPSLAVRLSCQHSTTLAEFRRMEPSQLVAELRGDLDWIVLKALEKDRTRRYETASSFANDIRCYLNHEPVSASPPTMGYLLGKFAQKNKRLITALAGVFAALLIGAVGMTILYLRAKKDRQAAVEQAGVARIEKAKAQQAQMAEAKQREQAQASARQLKQTLARADFDAGNSWMNQGRSRLALAYLARSLRTDPNYPPTAQLIVSILRDQNHDLQPETVLRGDVPVRSLVLNATQDRLLAHGADGTAWLWDARSHERLGKFGAEEPLRNVAFSPDGHRLVTLSSNGVTRVWSTMVPVALLTEIRSESGIDGFRLASQPDGGLVLATRSRNSDIQVWNGLTGKPATVPLKAELASETGSFVLGHEGKVVGGRANFQWTFWDTDGRSSPRTFPRSPSGFQIVSPKHNVLVQNALSPNELTGWDIATGRKLFTLPLGDYFFQNPMLVADGRRLVCFARGRIVSGSGMPRPFPGVVTLVVELPAGRVITQFLEAGVDDSPVVDETGRRSLARLGNTQVRLRDLQTGQLIQELELKEPLSLRTTSPAMVFADSGERFALNLGDSITIHDAQTGEQRSQIPRQPMKIGRVFLSPGGRRVATTSLDGNLHVWDSETGELLAGPLKHSTFVGSLLFDASEDRIFSNDYYGTVGGQAHGTIRIWDIRPTRARHEVPELPATVVHATFSPDGRWVAAALGPAGVAVIERRSRRVATTLKMDGADFRFVAIAPDGRRLAAVSANRLQVWHVGASLDARPLVQVADTGGFEMVRFSPDGRWLGTKSADRTVRVWDAASGAALTPPLPHEHKVVDLAFRAGHPEVMVMTRQLISIWKLNSPPGMPELATLDKGRSRWTAHYSPEGDRILTAGITEAQIWDANTKRLLDTIPHQSSVRGSAFSPDGGKILTAIPNATLGSPVPGTVLLWDLAAKKRLAELPHDDQVGELAFSPDGRSIVTSCLDQSLRMWNVETGKPVSVKLTHTHLDRHTLEVSPDSREVLSVARGKLTLYPMPFSATDHRPWLADLAEAVARQRLNDRGALEPVNTLAEMRRRLSTLAETDDYSRFGRWFMHDLSARSRSPDFPAMRVRATPSPP